MDEVLSRQIWGIRETPHISTSVDTSWHNKEVWYLLRHFTTTIRMRTNARRRSGLICILTIEETVVLTVMSGMDPHTISQTESCLLCYSLHVIFSLTCWLTRMFCLFLAFLMIFQEMTSTKSCFQIRPFWVMLVRLAWLIKGSHLCTWHDSRAWRMPDRWCGVM
jgi:hypothetical protein